MCLRYLSLVVLLAACGSANVAISSEPDAGPPPGPEPTGIATATAPLAPPTPPPPPPVADAGDAEAAPDVTEAGPMPGSFGGACDADAGTGCASNLTCWTADVPPNTYGTCVIVCGGPGGHAPDKVSLCSSLGYTCESMTALVDGCWRK